MEGCCFVSVFLCVFLSLRTESTSFRYQMVCVIYLEINIFTDLFCLAYFCLVLNKKNSVL